MRALKSTDAHAGNTDAHTDEQHAHTDEQAMRTLVNNRALTRTRATRMRTRMNTETRGEHAGRRQSRGVCTRPAHGGAGHLHDVARHEGVEERGRFERRRMWAGLRQADGGVWSCWHALLGDVDVMRVRARVEGRQVSLTLLRFLKCAKGNPNPFDP